MNKFAWLTSASILVGATTLLAVQDTPPPFPEMPAPQKEHQWLQQFVGEWTTYGKMDMGDGQAFECRGTEVVRSIGGRWIVSDMTGESPMGPMTAVMTLGYDPEQGKYIGTWVDSMTNHMWIYDGSVDASGKVLTLNATGPDMMDPTSDRTAEYRDVIEFKDRNTRVLTSSGKGPDGQWVTFGTVTFTRTK
jgi:hypothetical protein